MFIKKKNIIFFILFTHINMVQNNIKTRKAARTPSCSNFCNSSFVKDYTRRHYAYYGKKPSSSVLKTMRSLCLKNYCNSNCQGFDNLVGPKIRRLYMMHNSKRGYADRMPHKEKEELRKRGVLSTCVNPEDFYKLVFPKKHRDNWSNFFYE